jgi:membrane protease YdiL (CAAX protease family)
MHLLIPLSVAVVVWAVIIRLDLERGLLQAVDRFPSPLHRWVAYAWLLIFLIFLTFVVAVSSMHIATKEQLARTPFYQLFALHAILAIFLIVWWLLSGRPNVFAYLNIQRKNLGTAILTGFAIGFGGWVITLLFGLIVALLLNAAGLMPKGTPTPPMIGWLAALPAWKKLMVVLSAATIEEAFFRGWLQKRVGLLASTILFALAHAGFGQPFLLVGVCIISLVIGATFYRTKNLIPGVIAHGIFDAIQLFVTIPLVLNLTGS